MPVEIERKFRVTGDQWRSLAKSKQHLRDGLLAQFGGGKARVRLGANRAWLTIKGPRIGVTRPEYEYEVPSAEEMLNTLCNGQVVEKTRFLVPHDGLTSAVDVYEAALEGLVIAEIELDHEGQALRLWPAP